MEDCKIYIKELKALGFLINNKIPDEAFIFKNQLKISPKEVKYDNDESLINFSLSLSGKLFIELGDKNVKTS